MIYMAFFIKIPIYLLHVWLLKAHVEVPVYGYIIFRVGIIDRIMTGILYLVQIDIKSSLFVSSSCKFNIM